MRKRAMIAFVRRCLAVLLRPMLVGCVLIHAPLAFADNLPSSPSAKDSQFTLYARQTIMQDQELARFNVGVTVHSGVVTLWGRLPDAAMIRRATERVRQVPGLIDVRSEIRIIASEDEDRGSRIEDRRSKTEPGRLFYRARSSTVDQGSSVPASKTTTASYRSAPAQSPAVMPSIPLPPTIATANESLVTMVLQVRQGDVRYRLIQFEIRDGTIRLWSAGNQQDNLFAMAQAVARLPGVKRVIVENEFTGLHATSGR